MEMRLDGPQIAVFMDFENVATSAEANYGDFDVTAVTDLLRSRGRLLIKRAYGDWGRFHRYRRPMMENGIDLIQKVRKNHAELPIILLSGVADTLGLSESNTGANIVIQKSANEVSHLVRAVARLLRRKAPRKPPASVQSAPRARRKTV